MKYIYLYIIKFFNTLISSSTWCTKIFIQLIGKITKIVIPYIREIGIILTMSIIFSSFINNKFNLFFYIYGLTIIVLFIYFIYLIITLGLPFRFLFLLIFILINISTLFFIFPLIMLISFSLTGLFSYLFSSFYSDLFLFFEKSFKEFYNSNIIRFILSLDQQIFAHEKNNIKFDHFCYLTIFFSLNYVLLAKLYLLYSVKIDFNTINVFDYTLLSFLIFLCLFSYLLKSLLNLGRVLSKGYQIIFITGDDLPVDSGDKTNTVVNHSGFFNRHYHQYHIYNPRRVTRWFTTNRTIGICTFGIACVTCYYAIKGHQQSIEQTNQMKAQTRQAELQTYEARRMNDLSELSQGIITKEEYNKRYPPVSLPSFYEPYLYCVYGVIFLIEFTSLKFLFTVILLILISLSFITYIIICYKYFYRRI